MFKKLRYIHLCKTFPAFSVMMTHCLTIKVATFFFSPGMKKKPKLMQNILDFLKYKFSSVLTWAFLRCSVVQKIMVCWLTYYLEQNRSFFNVTRGLSLGVTFQAHHPASRPGWCFPVLSSKVRAFISVTVVAIQSCPSSLSLSAHCPHAWAHLN